MERETPKGICTGALCAVVTALLMASPVLAQESQRQTFTSPDGAYQFKYPEEPLIRCELDETAHEESYKTRSFRPWKPEICSTYIPICDDTSISDTVACLVNPSVMYDAESGSRLAAFFVAVVPEATSEKACLAGSKNWAAPRKKAQSATINGIHFRLFHIADNAAGHGMVGEIYRVFHHAKCYELGIQETFQTVESTGPITAGEGSPAQAPLITVLHSFSFLK